MFIVFYIDSLVSRWIMQFRKSIFNLEINSRKMGLPYIQRGSFRLEYNTVKCIKSKSYLLLIRCRDQVDCLLSMLRLMFELVVRDNWQK